MEKKFCVSGPTAPSRPGMPASRVFFWSTKLATEASGLALATSIGWCATPRECSPTCRYRPFGRPEWMDKFPEYLLTMAENTDGELLLITPAGLVRTVGGTLSPPETLPLPANSGELPKVRSLLVDREGNLWVGMIGKGLVRLRPAPLTAYGKDEGLSDSSFNTVFQDREGRIWLGGDLLYWFDGHRFHLVPGVATFSPLPRQPMATCGSADTAGCIAGERAC